MNRITCLLAALLLVGASMNAQDTTAVAVAVDRLEKAILAEDTVTIKALLTEDVAYGHSNGWVQTKRGVVDDMVSGRISYQAINRQSLAVDRKGDRAVVKERVAVEGRREGTPFAMNLFVLQLWTKEESGWRMVMRQSARQQ